ncbi:MAG: NUDIX hydrolase [Patescibacteria group bacterium]|nr:NUDIX hydrolase [Patescibacteria group bacterium]
MNRDFEKYQVSLKILLERDKKFLFLRNTKDDHLDLPGGRIDNIEGDIPLEKILIREVKEELGSKVKYKIGKPIAAHYRKSANRKVPVFVIVYEGKYISGSIKLSPEHSSYFWASVDDRLKRSDFCDMEEYQAFKRFLGE